MVRKYFILIFLGGFNANIFAQNTDTTTAPIVHISGYIEAYYGFDFDKPINNQKPFFIYNHKRHNETNINLAYVKATYNTPKTRANAALMVGNYVQYNLANEPAALRHIMEANIGIKLNAKKNIWLDAGIMPSHIGFESAVGMDCSTVSRSIVAENSPYYEAGIKVTATNTKENISVALMLLNGWQTIQKPNASQQPSYGAQLNYKPNPNFNLNYSNFVGSVQPDTANNLRTYHNFYAIYHPQKYKINITTGIDKDPQTSKKYWYAPVVILQYIYNDQLKIAARAEYFCDARQAILPTFIPSGLRLFGASINFDYHIAPNSLVRIEAKNYAAQEPIFRQNTYKNNFSLLATLSTKI
jgi:hypothetical protein